MEHAGHFDHALVTCIMMFIKIMMMMTRRMVNALAEDDCLASMLSADIVVEARISFAAWPIGKVLFKMLGCKALLPAFAPARPLSDLTLVFNVKSGEEMQSYAFARKRARFLPAFVGSLLGVMLALVLSPAQATDEIVVKSAHWLII